MNDSQWREKVFGPYNDAWKIIKILQHASDDNPDLFIKYMDEVQKFDDQYHGQEFADLLRTALLHRADDIIARMNNEM